MRKTHKNPSTLEKSFFAMVLLLITTEAVVNTKEQVNPSTVDKYNPAKADQASMLFKQTAINDFMALTHYKLKRAELSELCRTHVFNKQECASNEDVLNTKEKEAIKSHLYHLALSDLFSLHAIIGRSSKSSIEKLTAYSLIDTASKPILKMNPTPEEIKNYEKTMNELSNHFRNGITTPQLKQLFKNAAMLLTEHEAKERIEKAGNKIRHAGSKASFMNPRDTRDLETAAEKKKRYDRENGCSYDAHGRKSCMR